MTQYNSLNVKLSNSQLNKLKSSIKNETDVVLRISSNMVSNCIVIFSPRHLKYWVGVQRGQSYLMGRRLALVG